jgi:hypothetical protein
VDHTGGGISPAALLILMFIVMGIGLAVALRGENKK